MSPSDPEGATLFPEEVPTQVNAPAAAASSFIGRYQLLQKLGEGGMGEVWLAEQHEPVRRRVALKILKAGMDTERVVARFEAERQALALMNHPGVSRVFDAGGTPRGLPFFAMELVAGKPITTWCDERRLDPTARLKLMIRVCDAVQHAHQKGIIHRDLKPSNILVTEQDGEPAPKVIDFGLVKAIARPLTGTDPRTELGMIVGTPLYMSPEQAELGALEVDTRTDVYSLGVLLYELLTGTLPVDPRAEERLSLDALRRRIRESDPQRPSARITALGNTAEVSARSRGTEPSRLASSLRGDLDWIVMESLQRDPSRRYGSPAELAADIARHLAHEPVLAGPPSRSYGAAKFVRRHRAGVAAASVATLGLIVAVVASTVGYVRATRAESRAREEASTSEQISKFLVGLFRVSDPGEARGNSITAREVLDRGAENIDKQLVEQPEVKARLEQTLGQTYITLGLYDKAVELLRKSLALDEQRGAADDKSSLATRNALGGALWYLGRYDEAEKTFQENYERQKIVLGPDDNDTVTSIANLALLRIRNGDFPEAERMSLQVLESRKRALGPEDPVTLLAMSNLANVYSYQGRTKDAEQLYADTLALRKRVLGDDHPDTLVALNGLASVIFQEGRYAEAGKLYREALDGRRRVLGPDHPDVLEAMGNLAGALLYAGEKSEALEMMRQTVAGKERALGPDHLETLRAKATLGSFLDSTGHSEEGEAIVRAALAKLRKLAGEHDPAVFEAWILLASIQTDHHAEDALDSLDQAVRAGYLDAETLEGSDTFKAIRGNPRFAGIVEKAKANAAAARTAAP